MTTNDQDKKNKNQKETVDTISLPKNFLVPFLLLSLKQWNMHGYKLMQVLFDLGFTTLDSSNVYRILRQLEKESYIQSSWEHGNDGPAKRIYSITQAGEEYLKTCHSSFTQYQQMLQTFFSIYTSSFFPFSNSDEKFKKD
ncbi:poly-beta-hydroxybutyrate-responsive repressor [Gottfriedia solisilvae]|uniref:Poly-beta-hydroxybutyrate-responsive repressor n=1 Tax=Gottfriedia solisilvae TaxID=1516104 RepID=A0A8J3AJK4_9BACI|nr:poly-beta-hydroxybutyrate-responsive repressor [Gottfriedia solisilvae]GGI14693.1 poly-beta-hydroxybutyrate-responsive repressor [Gottfriedia solisilvae]